MLAAEAMRLAAFEALRPTASVGSDAGWPTLARHHVYDSTGILPEDLDAGAPFTPCLSLFTEEVRIERRGDAASSAIGFPTAVLIVIAELSVADRADDGTTQVFPLAVDDAHARLVLGALCAQVRKQLVFAEAGSIFRRIVGSVEDQRIDPFSLPQFDLRWMRNTMRFTCRIKDDKFTDAAGMPEPMASLYAALPAGSYAKAKLAALDAAFAATTRTSLDSIRFSTRGNPATGPAEGSAP